MVGFAEGGAQCPSRSSSFVLLRPRLRDRGKGGDPLKPASIFQTK